MMRTLILAIAVPFALAACSTTPRPLVPDTPDGPASYVCYSTWTASAPEVRAVAERQCGRWGLGVSGLIGQEWAPLRCGFLTPTVAAFRCGRYDGGYAFPELPAAP